VGRRASLPAGTEERLQKKEAGVSGIAFDAGGLIALDRNDRRVVTLLARALERGMRITIPATALAQAIRNPAMQARLRRLIRQAGTDLIALDGPDATAAGLLLARTATADIVDAHVAVCAQRAGQAVVTSDPGDLRRIAPGPRLVCI
jgi:predicted nucleic acid-binding protein